MRRTSDEAEDEFGGLSGGFQRAPERPLFAACHGGAGVAGPNNLTTRGSRSGHRCCRSTPEGFGVAVVSETVRHAASQTLAGDALVELLDILAAYRDAEAERVQLAVLALAGGDQRKVHDLVAAANRDYRDVLWWAETPDSRCHFEPQLDRRAMAARYAALGLPVPVTLRSGGET